MNILDDDNSIRFGSFKCLDTNRTYEVISTLSTFDLRNKPWEDKVTKAVDTIKRDDGESRKLIRSQLRSRFTNIEEYKQKPR